MKKIILSSIITIFLATACSRKTIPERSRAEAASTESKTFAENAGKDLGNNTETVTATPAAPVKTVKIITPKYITLNDAVAKKSIDGRLYYDLEGKRYWKNYKDGKYYLFNKNMTGNPDYKPRQ